MNKSLLFILSMAFCFTSIAQGDSSEDFFELSLEELLNLEVEVASKSKERLTDAPGIIQVITGSEIQKFGALNLGDIIDRSTSGFLMSGVNFPNNVTSLRGANNEQLDRRILLLINGRPIRESGTGGVNLPIYNAFPINIIDRIEIIRGPGSVLYGSNAYYGVINILTKRDEQAGGSIRTLAGSFGAVGLNGDYSYVKDDLSIMGSFNWFDEDGWEFRATDLLGVTDQANYYDDNTSFFLNSSYKNLDVNFLYVNTKTTFFGNTAPVWSLPPPQPQFDDPTNKFHDYDRMFSDIGYTFDITETFNSSLNVTYNYMKFGGNSSAFEATSDNDIYDFLIETSNRVELSEKFNFLFGGTAYLQYGALESLGIFDYSKTWYSAYFQADYKIIDPIKVVVGGQYNNVEQMSDFVPRLGLITNFTDDLGFKVLWGQSFRAPFAVETETFFPGILVGSSTVESEKLTNFDAQLFYTKGKIESYLTYFSFNSADQITLVQLNPGTADPTLTYVNGSTDLVGSGFEWENKFIPSKNLFFTGSFTYQENKSEGDGLEIDDATTIPNTMFKLGVSFQTDDKSVTVGVFNTYLSDFNSGLAGQLADPAPLAVNDPASSFNLLSINANFSLSNLLDTEFGLFDDIRLNIYSTNMLDEDINFTDLSGDINSFPGRPGRAFNGSLILKF